MIHFSSILSDPKKWHDLVKIVIGSGKSKLTIWFTFERPLAFRVNSGSFIFNKKISSALCSEKEYHLKMISAHCPFNKIEHLDPNEFFEQYDKALKKCFIDNAASIAIDQLIPKKEKQNDEINNRK